jgi:protocatechuate 3,4-dioxygenase beta subunit
MSAFLAACGVASPASSNSTASVGSTSSAVVASPGKVACVLSPELTDGPYYLDLNAVRSDIVEDRTGGILNLALTVADTTTCASIENAAAYVWHCDADGLYSGYVAESAGANSAAGDLADDGTFLWGAQSSAESGTVGFRTIYPGWYRGRTVHIHVNVHLGGNVVHTRQLLFDDDQSDRVFASLMPYSARPAHDTRDSNDGIYARVGSVSQLGVTESGGEHAAALTMGVRA